MDQVRVDILAVMARLSEAHPTMRFGQLVANVAYWSRGPTPESVWDVEDAEFLAGALSHLHQQTGQGTQTGGMNEVE